MAGGAASVLRSNTERRSNNTAAITSENSTSSAAYSRTAPNFMLTSHSEALLQGLNSLRCSDKLFDVTLIVEGRSFKVKINILSYFL